ncbi:hypothetical protein WJX72_008046 [[Myrmecia] bisecta]|uniref:Germin-like protein n=1 Tax=[Myrmecia] bisecta TaxID=41462 RepID=A0AAW1QRW1_9CHLO
MASSRIQRFAVVALLCTAGTSAAFSPWPIPEAQPSSQNQNDFYVLRNLPGSPPSTSGSGGNIRAAFVGQLPVLRELGMSAVVASLEPSASHLLHWHKGTEILYVINGNLTIGIYDWDNRVYQYDVTNGDIVAIPFGAAHFVHNRGPGRSINLSSFNVPDPGTQLSAQTLFAFANERVQDAIQVPLDQIQALRQHVPVSPKAEPTLYNAPAGSGGNFTTAVGSRTPADPTVPFTPPYTSNGTATGVGERAQGSQTATAASVLFSSLASGGNFTTATSTAGRH